MAEGNDQRPVRIVLEFAFPKSPSRKVVPADLEKAMQAAGMAARAQLENKNPPYKVLDLTARMEYAYVQASATENL